MANVSNIRLVYVHVHVHVYNSDDVMITSLTYILFSRQYRGGSLQYLLLTTSGRNSQSCGATCEPWRERERGLVKIPLPSISKTHQVAVIGV